MSEIVSRTLVATLARIDVDFPESGPHENRSFMSVPGIISARYSVDLDAIGTKLGRFLAEHTSTTRRDDDDSTVLLLSPWTVGDTEINQIADEAQVTMPSGLSARPGHTLARLDRLRAEISRLEAKARMLGTDGHWDVPRVIAYEWPVFGSRRFADATTPEAFYDACARDVRTTGAVVLSAGRGKTPLPDGIAATMAGNRGLQLLQARAKAKSE